MSIEIHRAESVFAGMSYGAVGPCEQFAGRVRGQIDPAQRLNAGIVNIEKTPRNAMGRVEHAVDLRRLKPVDPRKGNRRTLFDTINRRDKLALVDINNAVRAAAWQAALGDEV